MNDIEANKVRYLVEHILADLKTYMNLHNTQEDDLEAQHQGDMQTAQWIRDYRVQLERLLKDSTEDTGR